jgi:copper chaperone CopZ
VAAPPIKIVSIGVNGLTCSQCTRSVEMSVRKLDFVDSVVMDLANTEGKVYIKVGTDPDFKRIAKAVTNAGFSVRFVRFYTDINPSESCFTIGNNQFQWIGEGPPNGTELILIGDEFMPRKEALGYRKKMNSKCPTGKPIYYVAGK